eukprot:TRINITY_DN37333_c0_g1_i1.p1 TRINITY_DN37333_c0_g1~~TRINITY_DN37333_c0_g1_i1.p1  ORF type:complete len:520 (+),score=116.41 TRINITY_DN37333_c0_g1_i1:34-1560(+)
MPPQVPTPGTGKKTVRTKVKKVVKKVVRKKANASPSFLEEKETPLSILALPHMKKGETDDSDAMSDDSNSSSSGVDMDTMRGRENTNVLGSFMNIRTDNFIEAEPLQATGVRDTLNEILLTHRKATLSDDEDEDSNSNNDQQLTTYMEFAQKETSDQFEENRGFPSALRVGTDLPPWMTPFARKLGNGPLQNPTISLHFEISAYLKHTSLGKSDKQVRKRAGKAAMELVKTVVPDLSASLVGSLATRLADNSSTVDVSVSRKSPADKIQHVALQRLFETSNDWSVVYKSDAVQIHEDCLVVTQTSTGQRVTLILNDPTVEKTADFITAVEGVYSDKLRALVVVLKEVLRQRRIRGGLRTHVITLLAVSYLNSRRASKQSEEEGSLTLDNFGSLFTDFLLFLCFRFNSFITGLNPADPTGRVVLKHTGMAPEHHLHVIDPVTKKNAAYAAYNWALTREVLEHCVRMLSSTPVLKPVPGTHHALHPVVLNRSTLLSRIINSTPPQKDDDE